MENILVTAKVNPDLDGTACVFSYGYLINKTGRRAEGLVLGLIPREDHAKLLYGATCRHTLKTSLLPTTNTNERDEKAVSFLKDTIRLIPKPACRMFSYTSKTGHASTLLRLSLNQGPKPLPNG